MNKQGDLLGKWLGGLSIAERIKSCEQGELLTCLSCGYIIFDKELTEERIKGQRKCPEHMFVRSGHYIVISRGFRGVSAVAFNPPETAGQAILRHFKVVKREGSPVK